MNSKEITAVIIGPDCNRVDCRLNMGVNNGRVTFVPTLVGMHKVIICSLTAYLLENWNEFRMYCTNLLLYFRRSLFVMKKKLSEAVLCIFVPCQN